MCRTCVDIQGKDNHRENLLKKKKLKKECQ